MKRVRGMSIKRQLLAMTILPIIILGLIISVIAVVNIKNGMENEVLDGLTASAKFYKDTKLSIGSRYKDNEFEDELKDRVGYEFTWFDKDERAATSIVGENGKRPIGTKAAPEVIEGCLKSGKEFVSASTSVNGQIYCVSYVPVTDNKGNTIGMAFAGTPKSSVNKHVLTSIIKLVSASIVMLVVCGIFVFVIATRLANAIKIGVTSINDLALGQFKRVDMYTDRKDEIGEMLTSINVLVEKMRETAQAIHQSAGTVLTSSEGLKVTVSDIMGTTESVSTAVSEVAVGATEQAKDVQDSTFNATEIASKIQQIADATQALEGISGKMSISSEESGERLSELRNITDVMIESIKGVRQCISNTESAVDKIAEKVTVIDSIASQTNLLSLNASIEAARAGEAGKGFAVVASEIRNLADESAAAANEIRLEMKALKNESVTAVEQSGIVMDNTETQKNAIKQTLDSIQELVINIGESIGFVQDISVKVTESEKSKDLILSAMEGLSAISEENAASSEETSAAMDELNASISDVEVMADEMNKVAEELKERVTFFKF